MPLNPQSVSKRFEPERRAQIDGRNRIPLPSGMGWKVGARVYFSLARSSADGDEPPEFVITARPGMLLKGRFVSARIQRAGFAPLVRTRKKPRRCWP